MYYAKVRCADTFRKQTASILCAPHLCSLFPVCVLCRRRQKRQNKEQISELQVELDRPKTLLEDEKQVLQRKVSSPPIDRRHSQM